MLPATKAAIENLELPQRAVDVLLPIGSTFVPLTLTRRRDYDARVTALKKGRRRVTTASLAVGLPTPSTVEGWCQLTKRLTPFRELLCFAQRRSVNLVPTLQLRRTLGSSVPEPNSRAADYAWELIPPEQLEPYLGPALISYGSDGDGPWRNALIYYLASFRSGLWVTDRFLNLFIAFEVLAEQHAGSELTIVEQATFDALYDRLAEVLSEDKLGLCRKQRDQITQKLRALNGRSVGSKARSLLKAYGLAEYSCAVEKWKNARNDLAHAGVTGALPDNPAERLDGFWEPYVERLRGCLERLLLRHLIGKTFVAAVAFSDSFTVGDDGTRYQGRENWGVRAACTS